MSDDFNNTMQKLLNSACHSSDNDNENENTNIFGDKIYNLIKDCKSYKDGNLSHNNNSDEDMSDLRENNDIQQHDVITT